LRVSLAIDDLVVAGESHAAASVDAEARLDGSFDLRIQADALAGVVHSSADGTPAEVQLDTLTLPRAADPLELATALAALGPEARVSATTVLWQGRALGSLAARVRSSTAGITIEPLELSGVTGDAQGAVRCATATLQCHATFELSSRDAAATLRDFGFRDDLSARHAALAGELDWPVRLSPERSWLSSLTGKLTLVLSQGSTQAASAAEEVPFPLLAVSPLLRDSRGSSAAFERSSDEERLEFAQLAADYELRDGAAYTSNLHFDGDAEIVMTGRSGLASGDYDYRAWILRGEDRLPSAMRRLAAAPHVAAAWLALRDLVSAPADGPSRVELHLGGTWDAPVVGPVR
jgi:uncharacterized protein YhdP